MKRASTPKPKIPRAGIVPQPRHPSTGQFQPKLKFSGEIGAPQQLPGPLPGMMSVSPPAGS